MSILNHFGKVKTTFTPYTSKHSYDYGDKKGKLACSYNPVNNTYQYNLSGMSWYNQNGSVHTEHGRDLNHLDQKFIQNFYMKQIDRSICVKDFAMVVQDIVTDITSPVWETAQMRPILTPTQLVCLKVDDVDNRVDHLEKMLKQVIDDNKLLQRKIDALEQQKHIKDLRVARSIRVLIQELD
jgi:hypothetical protein